MIWSLYSIALVEQESSNFTLKNIDLPTGSAFQSLGALAVNDLSS